MVDIGGMMGPKAIAHMHNMLESLNKAERFVKNNPAITESGLRMIAERRERIRQLEIENNTLGMLAMPNIEIHKSAILWYNDGEAFLVCRQSLPDAFVCHPGSFAE
jgi:hypothetical protein